LVFLKQSLAEFQSFLKNMWMEIVFGMEEAVRGAFVGKVIDMFKNDENTFEGRKAFQAKQAGLGGSRARMEATHEIGKINRKEARQLAEALARSEAAGSSVTASSRTRGEAVLSDLAKSLGLDKFFGKAAEDLKKSAEDLKNAADTIDKDDDKDKKKPPPAAVASAFRGTIDTVFGAMKFGKDNQTKLLEDIKKINTKISNNTKTGAAGGAFT
jgi:hypothetical protein